jgi:hypothetical protein
MTEEQKKVLSLIFARQAKVGYRKLEVASLLKVLPELTAERMAQVIGFLSDEGKVETDKGNQTRFSQIPISMTRLVLTTWLEQGSDFLDFDPKQDLGRVEDYIERAQTSDGPTISQYLRLASGRVDMAVTILAAQRKVELKGNSPPLPGFSFLLVNWHRK